MRPASISTCAPLQIPSTGLPPPVTSRNTVRMIGALVAMTPERTRSWYENPPPMM